MVQLTIKEVVRNHSSPFSPHFCKVDVNSGVVGWRMSLTEASLGYIMIHCFALERQAMSLLNSCQRWECHLV